MISQTINNKNPLNSLKISTSSNIMVIISSVMTISKLRLSVNYLLLQGHILRTDHTASQSHDKLYRSYRCLPSHKHPCLT